MAYKWSTETTKKSVVYDDGSTHTLEIERHWIDVVKLEHCRITVELNYLHRDNEKPEVSCMLRLNGDWVQEWFAPTLEEARNKGEKLIEQIKNDVNSIT